MQRWVERSEARWALWAGIVGAIATAALSTKMILSHAASSAALGFVVVPFVALAAAVPIGIWGAAVGHVALHLRGRAAEPRILFWVALAAAASLPTIAGFEVWKGRSLEGEVAQVRRMNARELERAFDESRFRRDKYFLGAIVANPAASTQLIGRIAELEDPALAQPMWSLWDVMGENRRGESVLALAARHPNAPASVKSMRKSDHAR